MPRSTFRSLKPWPPWPAAILPGPIPGWSARTSFLQLLGFYFFGRVLFRSRFWALLLALLTAMPFLDVGVGEIWGIWRDALPRISFQTVLPYLLTLVVLWRSQPRRWPWLMILAGLMVYLHSVSTPAWAWRSGWGCGSTIPAAGNGPNAWG